MNYTYDQKAERKAIRAMKEAIIILAGGNGGSAEQASHFVAEITGSFEGNMDAEPAMSMCANTAEITAFANDFGYDQLFCRYAKAFDSLDPTYLFITTSGTSNNIVNVIRTLLKDYNYDTTETERIVLLTGNGDKIPEDIKTSNITIITCPYTQTAKIQECHMHILHNIAYAIKFNQ